MKTRAMTTLAAMVLGGTLVLTGAQAFAGNAFGRQCPKGTRGVHGQCVSALARGHGHATTSTTVVSSSTTSSSTTSSSTSTSLP